MIQPCADDTAPASIEAIFAAQASTVPALRESTRSDRRRMLSPLRDELMARRTAFHEAFQEDAHKASVEVDLTELLPVLDGHASHLESSALSQLT
jgi:hypothetical protein